MHFDEFVDWAGRGIEAAGVAAIVLGAVVATLRFFMHLRSSIDSSRAYRVYREGLGRALLLGLELLVAADIIRTVATEPTFRGVGILAAIVLIGTFLSVALELEIEGRWPWQARGPGGGSVHASEPE